MNLPLHLRDDINGDDIDDPVQHAAGRRINRLLGRLHRARRNEPIGRFDNPARNDNPPVAMRRAAAGFGAARAEVRRFDHHFALMDNRGPDVLPERRINHEFALPLPAAAAAHNDDAQAVAAAAANLARMERQMELLHIRRLVDDDFDDDDDNDDDDDADDNAFPLGLHRRAGRDRVAVRVREREQREQQEEELYGPGLYNLMVNGGGSSSTITCTCALRGSVNAGCRAISQRCRSHPVEVHYQNAATRRSPLHEAALSCACRRVVESILNAVRDSTSLVTNVDADGNTPLMSFLKGLTTRRVETESLLAMMTLLLGPSPEVVAGMANRDGFTPLHVALAAPEIMCPVELIQRLVLLRPQSLFSRTNSTGQTPLHVHCQRPLASVEVAHLMLETCNATAPIRLAEGVNETNIMIPDAAKGYYPLHYAVLNGNIELVQLLLVTPIVADAQTHDDAPVAGLRSRYTNHLPLHIACQYHPHNKELIEVLMQAAPQAAFSRDAVLKSTPVHLLCKQTPSVPVECLRVLIAPDADCLSVPDEDTYLPLHYASGMGAHINMIKVLLESYPKGALAHTRKHDTALSLACAANQSPATVQLLIDADAKAVVKANQYGFIPIHCACRSYQPKLAILQALVWADPQCAKVTAQSGDVALQLARNNKTTSVVVLEYLASVSENVSDMPRLTSVGRQSMMLDNKKGNNPLHSAILRQSPVEIIETTAMTNSRWIFMRNNAGSTPLQLLCKNGQAELSVISIFAQIGGPTSFAITDDQLRTPLHLAMQQDAPVEFLEALIRAYPEALHMKTIYDDTPLHLAAKYRVHPDAIRMLAMASSAGLERTLRKGNTGRLSPILMENSAGQTPISIAMENYQRICLSNRQGCSVKATFDSERTHAFKLLAMLVKILHYGPVDRDELGRPLSLVVACVSLHRMNVRLDPAFIRRALFLYPEEVLQYDKGGNYPLHIEASIPIEKMMLLEPTRNGCCNGACQKRAGILRALFDVFPEAACQLNEFGEFPLSLMALGGRTWDDTFMLVVQTFPEAIYAVEDLESCVIPLVVKKLVRKCGIDTVYSFMRNMPGI